MGLKTRLAYGVAALPLGGASAAHADEMLSLAATAGAVAPLPLVGVAVTALALAVVQRRRAVAAEKRARYFAHHEPMTGLLNRPHFITALDEALSAAPERPVAILSLDLNGLREINDLLGHESGDEAIIRMAQALVQLAGETALVGRLGGDKFAIARFGAAPEAAKDLCIEIIDAVERPFTVKGQDVSMQVQIGVTLAPADGGSAVRLLKSAGLALDRARLRGGSCYVFFERTLETELQRRRDLEQQIRDTLAADAFDLHFQPLFNRTQDRLTGFEALLRMPDGAGGYVSPAIFIPVAEEIGLIIEIGAWVVRRACALAAHWPDHLTVAVNLSPAQFKAGGVHKTVQDALAAAGLPAERLELEITEGLILNDDAGIMRELTALKSLGVSIVMDDFGTGYSSLSYLWKFPFDKIKIDRSFMRALGTEDRQVVDIIQAIMSLSRSLRMRVTAEGVETKEQADFLRSIDCDEVQGFFFAKPMPIDQVALTIMRDVQQNIGAQTPPPAATALAG
ncbi:MAG TPA: bifunctional diguanylate cyclase/phosphodiesterase [Microvirga sp.]|jgi:diguanylate cyclase (GGDEF)-like protein|nr:bifunctional diguanylate cyclase/phosphodiesterase [Microvirga sp.]